MSSVAVRLDGSTTPAPGQRSLRQTFGQSLDAESNNDQRRVRAPLRDDLIAAGGLATPTP
ncbi:MAG TPA: hypothetical protein VL309_10645 [Vicinamibacterales bacterium]|nr:hypothetical protein [Vicinamibacterales bacterium]